MRKLDAYVTQTLYGVKPGLPFGASLQCVEGDEAIVYDVKQVQMRYVVLCDLDFDV